MPLCTVVSALIVLGLVLEHLFAGNRADCRDLCISNAEFGGVVEHWVDMESRIARFSTQQTQLVNEVFLEGIGKVVLCTEEDYAAL